MTECSHEHTTSIYIITRWLIQYAHNMLHSENTRNAKIYDSYSPQMSSAGKSNKRVGGKCGIIYIRSCVCVRVRSSGDMGKFIPPPSLLLIVFIDGRERRSVYPSALHCDARLYFCVHYYKREEREWSLFCAFVRYMYAKEGSL